MDLLLVVAFVAALYCVPGVVWWWWEQRQTRKRRAREEFLADWERTHGYPFVRRYGPQDPRGEW